MDPIADLLVRIKNAQGAGHDMVEVPFSSVKLAVAKILEERGFIEKIERQGIKSKEKLEIKLKYDQGIGAIGGAKRVSKPGQRAYVPLQKIRAVRQGYGLAIISTSQGIMSDKDARKKKIGGEVLCEIW